MVKIENHCVGCPPEMGCISCSYSRVEVHYCDTCGEEVIAEYEIDGEDMCFDCALRYCDDVFDEMTLKEKLEMLDVDFKELNV